jgi:methylase of polypeptide subunit release factors
LSDLIKRKQNSIWAFIVRNSYRPAMLRDRFDFILGNPPWLTYRYIADPDYQAEIKKRAVEDYAIAPTHQKLFTQMELATAANAVS